MNIRIRNRNQFILGLALLCLAVAVVCVLPALFALAFCLPKAAAGLSLAGIGPFALLRCEDMEGRGGGGEGGLMLKVANALEALDNKTKALETEIASLKGADVPGIKGTINTISSKVADLARQRLSGMMGGGVRMPGRISDDAAQALAASVILHVERSGKLDAFIPNPDCRSRWLAEVRSVTKAMTTTEVPLPSTYGSQLLELIAEFGVFRKNATWYPMGPGINKPPRIGDRPAFGSIAMSAAFGEKKPSLGWCTLTSKKIGGIVILPRELEDQNTVAVGQFLARYGAVEFARAEDTWGFLADGSATYETAKGVCKVAADGGKVITLAAGKTKPSDATLDNFRDMRGLVSTAALSGGKYYINQTWESKMRAFNTPGDPTAFVYRPDGTATLDGFPIVWTEVMQPYNTQAAAEKFIAAFGKLSFWYLGERGTPRIDTSEHVYFANDQLATRFIEEIDFDYLSMEAMSVMRTAAA